MRYIIFLAALFFLQARSSGQGCCSGGSGSPIAGGAAQGVLQERQLEISANHQYNETNRFFVKDSDTTQLFDNLFSNYLYGRLAYGVTNKLTMSIESGYFINKTQYGLKRLDTIRSSGIADLIVFPRYNLLSRNTELTRTEITVGMGMKIPLGKYNDSTVVYRDSATNTNYYTTAPPTVQPTNGSNDFIFYGFVFRSYNEKQFRMFANMIYIRKGWNPLGQKFGDYANLGLFVGKTVFDKVGLTLQVRGEMVGKMHFAGTAGDMLALYNVDVYSTGSKKIFVGPQVSYTYKGVILYALYETPVYQYVNGTQVGSGPQVTTGISYRFFVKEPKIAEPADE